MATYLTVHQRARKFHSMKHQKSKEAHQMDSTNKNSQRLQLCLKQKLRKNYCDITKAMVTFTDDSKSHKFIVIA